MLKPNSPHIVDLKRLNSALSGKIGPCPLCGKRGTLSAMPTLMELREYHSGDFVVGGTPIIPLVVLTCSNCGNTVLINALAMKLMDIPSPSEGEK